MGGLGLTTGILDAFASGNALVRVIRAGEDPALLTDCANARRTAWLTTTNPFSIANLERIASEEEGDVRAREQFFERRRTDQGFLAKLRAETEAMPLETFQEGIAAETFLVEEVTPLNDEEGIEHSAIHRYISWIEKSRGEPFDRTRYTSSTQSTFATHHQL